MLNSVDFSGKPFHFLGVGGIGMSALAYVLAKRNIPVSGSDIRLSHITQRLQEDGVHIFGAQEASNLNYFQYQKDHNQRDQWSALTEGNPVQGAGPAPVKTSGVSTLERETGMLPQVVCSTAIATANPEYHAALELGCSILHRSDVLAALIQASQGIAIAGTHGKTTTSSLVGHLLREAGLDPTIVVGGEVNAWGGNAVVGAGPHLVAEADESDGSLVKMHPAIGVITNIELDHPDHYSNLQEVIDIFKTFESHCQILIGCLDSPTLAENFQPTISYSLNPKMGADYSVLEVQYGSKGTTAQVMERGEVLGTLTLRLLGSHNLSNALAAVAIGRHLNLDFPTIAQGIASFEGTRRRFEHRGEANEIVFIDDYAHHPSELQVTLAAAQLRKQDGDAQRVVAIFQPHRYSRTATFLDEFATAFADADVVVLSDIYSAGESNPGNLSGQTLADRVKAHHSQVYYEPTMSGIAQRLQQLLRPGDLALFLGAGNLNQLIPEALVFHQSAEAGLPQAGYSPV